MAQIGKELKKTFSQFSSAFKSEEQQPEKLENSNILVEAAGVNEEKVEKYRRTLNKVENDYTGRILNTVSQKNKPRKALYLNESESVRAMEMKEVDDAFLVIDELREGQPVLLVFDDLEKNVQERILDRIYGACHYGAVKIEKLKGQLLLIDPKPEKKKN
jgi:FtsZ-interacting cell division protein YlmF